MLTNSTFTLLYSENQSFIKGEINNLYQKKEAQENIQLQIEGFKAPYFLSEGGIILSFLFMFIGSISSLTLGVEAILELITLEFQIITLIQSLGILGVGIFAFYLSYILARFLYLMIFYVRSSNSLAKNYHLLIKSGKIERGKVLETVFSNGEYTISYMVESNKKNLKSYVTKQSPTLEKDEDVLVLTSSLISILL